MPDIFIMRHGEAEGRAPSDQQRHLTARGQHDALVAGKALAEYNIPLLCHSPYTRTCETADAVCHGFSPAREVWPELTPDSSPEQLLEKLQTLQAERVLLVSHQPLVGKLTALLVDGSAGFGLPFATASIARLSSDIVASGCARLLWHRAAQEL